MQQDPGDLACFGAAAIVGLEGRFGDSNLAGSSGGGSAGVVSGWQGRLTRMRCMWVVLVVGVQLHVTGLFPSSQPQSHGLDLDRITTRPSVVGRKRPPSFDAAAK